MELHQLECFLELSKFQNVSLTAANLNISQPALSKTISLLESELGVKLFDRVGRRIYLNEHGRYFARYAEQAMNALQTGRRNVKKLNYQPSGTITLGLFSYINLIADCLHDFSAQYPLVKFETYSSKSQYTIDNFDSLDFALSSSLNTSGVIPRESFSESFPIAEEQYALVIAPELLAKYVSTEKNDICLSSLFRVPFLAMPKNLLFTDITQVFCLQAGFSPNVLIQTNDYATKLHMTALGTVAAFIPEVCIPVFRSFREDFRFLYCPDINTRRTISLSRKKSASPSQIAQLFWDFVLNYYRLEPDSEKLLQGKD